MWSKMCLLYVLTLIIGVSSKNATINCSRNDDDTCQIRKQNGSCLIQVTMSILPLFFTTYRTCVSSSRYSAAFHGNNSVTAGWTQDGKIIVYHLCKDLYCNKNFEAAGLYWIRPQMLRAADHCVLQSKTQLRPLSKSTANISEPINVTCMCTENATGPWNVPCTMGQCRSKYPQLQGTTFCGKMELLENGTMEKERGCYKVIDRSKIADFLEAHIYNETIHAADKRTSAFICRDKDCTSNSNNMGKSIKRAICDWTKSKFTKSKSTPRGTDSWQWWYFVLASVFIWIAIVVASWFVIGHLGVGIRLVD